MRTLDRNMQQLACVFITLVINSINRINKLNEPMNKGRSQNDIQWYAPKLHGFRI